MRISILTVVMLAAPTIASAQVVRERESLSIGVDIGAAFTTSQGADSATGPASLVRAGYEFCNGLTPELAISYARWSRRILGSDSDITEHAISVLPGLRWSILASAVRPWISLHIGYGLIAAGDETQTGMDVNTGAGVDWFFAPRIGAAIHVTWNKVIIDQTFDLQTGEAWIDTGAGLAFLW